MTTHGGPSMLGTGEPLDRVIAHETAWVAGAGRHRLVTSSCLTDHFISSSSHSHSPGFSSSSSWLPPRVPLALSLSPAFTVTSPVCWDQRIIPVFSLHTELRLPGSRALPGLTLCPYSSILDWARSGVPCAPGCKVWGLCWVLQEL